MNTSFFKVLLLFISIFDWIVIFVFFVGLIICFLKCFKIRHLNSKLLKHQKLQNKAILEKVILIKEIQHRVKNNLQIVLSLLNIQSRINKSPELDEFLIKSEKRVNSMLLIHETLCNSDDVSKVCAEVFIKKLVKSIFDSYSLSNVVYVVKVEKIELGIDKAIPLGLIINEIINNSFKYAFPNNINGLLELEFKSVADKYKLILSDNGIGYSSNIKRPFSIGLDLVELFVEQLNGHLEIKSSNGVVFNIEF
jgi:two-component sensor histidine kinase